MTAIAESDISRRVVVATPTNRFYVRMAYACAAIAFLGFAPTYWVPVATGRFAAPAIVHLHALVFYGWLALLIVQTRYAATRQLSRHREFGVVGVSLATAMCFIGTATAITSMKQGEAAGAGEAARAFSIVPLTGIAFFALLFAIALLKVKRADVHKRLILVATISLLQAAVGRVFLIFMAPEALGSPVPPPVLVTVMPGIVSVMLLVVAMLHDRRNLGRVHPVYWVAGTALIAVQVLRVPLSTTATWHSIAGWFAQLI